MLNKNTLRDLKRFCRREYQSEPYYCIVYGSSAYNLNKKDPDLDLVFLSEKNSIKRRKRISEFIFLLHKKYKLTIDSEVPSILKTSANFKFLEKALNGEAFKKTSKKVIIPPIKKTKKFLSSDEVLMRLLLNSHTGKTLFISGDRKKYNKNVKVSRENLIRLMFLHKRTNSFSLSAFIELILGKGEETGEMFMGYKKKNEIVKYLIKVFKKEFEILVKNKKLSKCKGIYSIKDTEWLYEILKKNH